MGADATGLRRRIALLLAAAIAISYFDRHTQFSQLVAAFLVAYAGIYAGGGKLTDGIGTRKGSC